MREDHVEGFIEGEVGKVSADELSIRAAISAGSAVARRFDHLLREIAADHFGNVRSERDAVEPRTAADIEHARIGRERTFRLHHGKKGVVFKGGQGLFGISCRSFVPHLYVGKTACRSTPALLQFF